MYEPGSARQTLPPGPDLFRERIVAGALAVFAVLLVTSRPAAAHVSEQVFVLILPTGVYTTAGVATVLLTIVLLAALPARMLDRLFTPAGRTGNPLERWRALTSLAALAALAFLVYCGIAGSRDPLANPLPLFIWTVWWIGLLSVQMLVGDLWHWVNPWTGAYSLLRCGVASPGITRLPEWLASWPAVAHFMLFAIFMLADPAPDDAGRLAVIVAGYWAYTFAGMLVFGATNWLARCECFTILFGHLARVAFLKRGNDHLQAGIPGWQLVHAPGLTLSGGLFVLLMLGVGSFDGLNETFWWLGVIDVNPLEFPGRSAIIAETVTGTLVANLLLVLIFGLCVYFGLAIVGETGRYLPVAGRLVYSILPIAAGYHVAHYLTAIMINGQYALAAANDPLATGANYLGLDHFHVTTGFLNTLDSVRIIWLTQAGAVVGGHVLSIVVAHAIAVDLFKSNRKAVLSQIPIAAFMVFYTFFGLWLLASPRGA